MAKAGERKDPLSSLADSLRAKNGIPWRTAVVADSRKEFVRGKDFVSHFKEHNDVLGAWVNRALSQDDQIRALAELFMRRGLFFKAERQFKKPKPGKKRLAKWPKKLLPLHGDRAFTPEHFYYWVNDRPASPYLWLFSVLFAVVVLLACLFPLAPHPVKLAVVYISMVLLCLILSTIALRCAVAALTWLLLGRSLWLLPNMLQDDKGLDEAFWPLWQMDEPPEKRGITHWLLRVLMGLTTCMTIWTLYQYVPDAKGAAPPRDLLYVATHRLFVGILTVYGLTVMSALCVMER
ncbi:hypothetical protein WJX73_000818 [Symbiochloris irregularis]|uniref:Translocation protein SEC62 n=1 Tax=Symbiochloris irregularis TaxID=706552 RepID=A0AAW1P784_9CHLO